MGKLGGFELNFSSDIDLIFTYPSQGETVGVRRAVDNAKFFTRLGQRLINALDQFTPDGFVYRTDMRLRPFGDSGALALSFSAIGAILPRSRARLGTLCHDKRAYFRRR